MRRQLFLLSILFGILLRVNAQGVISEPNIFSTTNSDDKEEVTNKSFKDRLVFGGGLGLQFGSSTNINISPTLGYRITNKFTSGIGITYIYDKSKFFTGYGNETYTIERSIYGGSIWSQYRVIPQAFLHAEYGVLNLSIPVFNNFGQWIGNTPRVNVNQFLVGGGYYQAIGEHSGMQLSLLWDLIQDHYAPYQNPIIRIGFTAGF